MIVLGLAIAIVGVFLVSSQIDKQTRKAIAITIQSNEMILARLEHIANPLVRLPPSPDSGIALERRRAQRRNLLTQMLATAGKIERRGFPHRRVDDLLSS